MEYIASPYKLTFGSVTILAFGQWISEELAISLEKACEVINPIDSKNAFIRDADASTYSFSIKTYTTAALDVDARVAAMQALVAVSTYSSAPLRVEIQGYSGHFWTFSSAFIKVHRPVRILQSAVARWERQWDIVATGLSFT